MATPTNAIAATIEGDRIRVGGTAQLSGFDLELTPARRRTLEFVVTDLFPNGGDVARARQIINDHIANPYQRRQALSNIEQQEMFRAMNAGKVEEALRTISALRTSRERATHLAQIAGQI